MGILLLLVLSMAVGVVVAGVLWSWRLLPVMIGFTAGVVFGLIGWPLFNVTSHFADFSIYWDKQGNLSGVSKLPICFGKDCIPLENHASETFVYNLASEEPPPRPVTRRTAVSSNSVTVNGASVSVTVNSTTTSVPIDYVPLPQWILVFVDVRVVDPKLALADANLLVATPQAYIRKVIMDECEKVARAAPRNLSQEEVKLAIQQPLMARGLRLD